MFMVFDLLWRVTRNREDLKSHEQRQVIMHSTQKMSRLDKKRSRTSENIANRLWRMDSNTSPNSSQDFHGKELIDDAKNDKKKGRGESKLNLVSGQQKVKELERNEFGQQIGDNSVKKRSAKFEAMREKQRYNHTMSRRCYAHLAHIVETTSSTDTPITRTKVWVEGH